MRAARAPRGRVAAAARAALASAAAALVPAGAAAQAPPAVPALPRAAAEPGLFSPEFQRRELEAPGRVLRAAPRPAPTAPAPAAAGAGAGARFVLRGVSLAGATAIPPAELEPLWRPLLGAEVGPAELEELAARISARYRAAGYVLSQAIVPAQPFADGVARLRVVEGRVGALSAQGGGPAAAATALRLLAPAAAERPLRLGTLERGLLLSRDLLGGAVEAIVRPSPDTFGAADVTLDIAPRPVQGFVAADNRASRVLGPWIARAGATGWGLLGRSERLDAQVAATPGSAALRFGQLAAALPLPGLGGTPLDGAAVQLSGDHTRADPDLRRAGIDPAFAFPQRETNLRLGLAVPLVRTRPENLQLRTSLAWRESTVETRFDGARVGELTDRLLVFEPRLAWDFADRLGGITLLEGALRQGLGLAGATRVGATGAGAGRPDFTLVQAAASRLQRIDAAGRWSVLAEAVGQWAPVPLPLSERFALGGERLGRGFGPGNTTGDSGFGARLELRLNVDAPALGRVPVAAQPYAFADWGAAVDRSAARDGNRWESLGSVGAGVRIDLGRWLTLNPEVATQVAGRPTDTARGERQTRFLFAVVARF